MISERDLILRRWQDRIKMVPAAYRWLAFTIAAIQISLFPASYYSQFSPVVLLSVIGVYTILMMPYSFNWRHNRIAISVTLVLDILLCFLLVLWTRAIYSPFLLYTLVPVVTAAMLMKMKITITVASLTGIYVISSHLWNPFSTINLSPSELSYILVYFIAIFLTAFLPYLINANLRQRMEFEDILRERKRLSREIHDGLAQTVFTLRWQVQLVDRRLNEMSTDLPEMGQLVKLSADAHRDTRECLEILRSYSGDESFISHLKEHVSQMNHNLDVRIDFDTQTDTLRQEPWTEIELFRICKEALANISKHANAKHAVIKLRTSRNHLNLSISDDGCGFDISKFNLGNAQNERQGLSIMKERAVALDGNLTIQSSPEQGTVIQVNVPINKHRGKLLWTSQ